MKELLSFNTMLTPKLITIVYYLGLLAVLLSGLSFIISGFVMHSIWSGLLTGIAIIVLGALVVRVYCEIFLVFFKMNEALQDLRNKPSSNP